MSRPEQDLTRTTLGVLFIGGLITASFWVIWPFLPAIVWAVTLVIATWSLMLRVQRHVGNRRGLAVLVMTVALLLVLIVPFWLAISTIVANVDQIADMVRTVLSLRVPPPPDWLAEVPLVGAAVAKAWEPLTSAGVQRPGAEADPLRRGPDQWFASAAGSLGGLVRAVPADCGNRRGPVRQGRARPPPQPSASAAGWVASAARWRCVWPVRRSEAWRSASW